MEMLSGAQMVIRALEDLGVDKLFGYPGGSVLHIYDALLNSSKIKHILCRHEQAAVHMADGYARATGKVGCVLVTSGPGATNTITGIATAYMDSIPLVVLTGQVPTTLIGQDAFQEVDMVGISRPVVKHSFLCRRAEDIPEYIRKAFHIASTGRPGPVVVDIPKDTQNPQLKFPYHEQSIDDIIMRSYNPTLVGHKGQIKRAVKMIAEAKRPVLLLGGGVIASNASEKVAELAHKFNLPVTMTLMGLGAFPASDKQCLGMLGMHGTYAANTTMHNSDLIVALGARFDDRVTNNVAKFCPEAKIIHIDIDPSSISKCVSADIPIVGNIDTVLEQMNDVIKELDIKPAVGALNSWWDQINGFRAAHPLSYEGDGTPGMLHPAKIVSELYKRTNGNANVVTDVGQHQMFAALYYPLEKPRHFMSSGGLGTMGYGFPAAIGVKIAKPDEEVICITGDGSFQMNLQELACCLQYKIPVKVFIINNRSLGMVKQWQMMFYNGRQSESYMDAVPDFVKLAESYGQIGLRVNNESELGDVIDQALAVKDKTVVVDIVADPDSRVYPMQIGTGSMADMFLSKTERT
ncbi:MAG: biosynthetic-type acetolactate synthase large subunit [Succinivibrionaceae bacterium]|nr:biosynthetic-type acetolactate synthase large subunit [Succinivibrionaceae bacterium]